MNSENVRKIESTLPVLLPANRPPTEDEVTTVATQLRVAFPITQEEFDSLLKRVYARVAISMDIGTALVAEHKPWLSARKPSIDPHYWARFNQLLTNRGWPRQVTSTLDSVTDELLDLLGNPAQKERFNVRGLVVGRRAVRQDCHLYSTDLQGSRCRLQACHSSHWYIGEPTSPDSGTA